jgi:hypothetical protein
MTGAGYSYHRNQAGMEYLLSDPNGPTGQTVTRLGNSMVNYAKQYANVDTGNMRSRIEFRLEQDGRDLVGIIAARTSYAQYVHDGTIYYEGNPFLLDAARTVLGQ